MRLATTVRACVGVLTLLASFVLVPQAGAQTVPQDAPTICRQVEYPVSINPLTPDIRDQTVSGTLCTPPGAKSATVQLLVHGITYDRTYWDFPYQPKKYSYVRAANAAGYSTFNIDRVGSGRSSHPRIPETITTDGNALQLHQIVQGLRGGHIGEHEFAKVVMVGHSYGSFNAMVESSRYNDVDGVIISGFMHYIDPRFFGVVPGDLVPASLNAPQRFGNLLPGYLTSRDRNVFYHTPNADPNVIAYDEAHKQLVTDAEMATFEPEHLNSINTRAPVLSVIGDADGLFCPITGCSSLGGIVLNLEHTFWPQAQSFDIVDIPRAGHDLNLQRNAHHWFNTANSWIDRNTA